MIQDDSVKHSSKTAPERSFSGKDPVHFHKKLDQNLGIIKFMAVLMAVLIVVALCVIAVTIYSRLTSSPRSTAMSDVEFVVPDGSRLTDVRPGLKGELVLVFEHDSKQEIWQVGRNGRLHRKIIINRKK